MKTFLKVSLLYFIVLLAANFPVQRPCSVCGETALVEPAIKLFWECPPITHYECVDKIPYDPTAIDRIREELGR